MPARKKTAPKKKEDNFDVSLRIHGREYKASGKTITEALGKIKVGNVKGIAIMVVTHGENIKDRILTIPQTYRIFNGSEMTREVAMKQVENLFSGI